MKYKDIYKPLSRTSFSSKMEFAFEASVETMSISGQLEASSLAKKILPEEIECFVLNSVVANEYNNREMKRKEFISIINAIREYHPPIEYEKLQAENLRWVLPTHGAVQFELQQNILCRLYRHYNLFTFKNEKINVNQEFVNRFERQYKDYCSIVLVLHILLVQKKYAEYKRCLDNINRKYSWFFRYLSIDREQYIEELRQFASNYSEYIYCLRPSYSYPFIKYEDNIYLPTPHLLVHSITSAFLNRLTFENLDLREKIGKNAFEKYIYKIAIESKQFDEVFPEYEYEKGQKTLDVLARKNDVALLLECKMFSPKVDLRIFDAEAYEKDLLRIVKCMVQAYKHSRFLFNYKYYPFSADTNNVFALIIVYQDAYVSLEDIYSRTAEELNINESSDDYKWLLSHIGFADVASLERYLLNNAELLPALIDRGSLTDKWLYNHISGDLIDEVLDFKNYLFKENELSIHELFK